MTQYIPSRTLDEILCALEDAKREVLNCQIYNPDQAVQDSFLEDLNDEIQRIVCGNDLLKRQVTNMRRETDAWYQELKDTALKIYRETGRKVPAMRFVRDYTGWDLKKNKDFVESLINC